MAPFSFSYTVSFCCSCFLRSPIPPFELYCMRRDKARCSDVVVPSRMMNQDESSVYHLMLTPAGQSHCFLLKVIRETLLFSEVMCSWEGLTTKQLSRQYIPNLTVKSPELDFFWCSFSDSNSACLFFNFDSMDAISWTMQYHCGGGNECLLHLLKFRETNQHQTISDHKSR